MLGFALAASAADVQAPAEEIVIWGDRFARWERRWWVETEVHLPQPIRLLGWANTEMHVSALRVRAVLSCDKDLPLGPRTWEVHCDVEALALEVTPVRRSKSDDALLAELDDALEQSALQLQVSDAGRVANVDLEGVPAQNERTRERQEALRQVMSRVVLPFHLEAPDQMVDGLRWTEWNSRLLSMPAARASAGSSQIAHAVGILDDAHLVVQSVGRSTTIPVGGVEILQLDGQGMASMVGGRVDSFALEMTGVAVFDRDTGILSERVWAVGGALTASSPSAEGGGGPTYAHLGRLRMLGDDEHPDVGRSVVDYRQAPDPL